MGEMIKTAILAGDDFLEDILELAVMNDTTCGFNTGTLIKNENFKKCIKRAIMVKSQIVSEDPKELGHKRALLNLGHTFAHALESCAGLGNISHGEAVIWGIARACELGCAFGITPKERAKKIINVIKSFDYYYSAPHPLSLNIDAFFNAIKSDKKIKNGKLTFVVPDNKSARLFTVETDEEKNILMKIIKGEYTL
jgi:3-dehydroquinate synthase